MRRPTFRSGDADDPGRGTVVGDGRRRPCARPRRRRRPRRRTPGAPGGPRCAGLPSDLEMRMTPAEALWSATAGGARALDRDDVGVLAPGRRAHLAVLDAPSYLPIWRCG